MRAVIQRVSCAKVFVDDTLVGEIGKGILVFLGVDHGDEEKDAEYLASKTIHLRIFEDNNGKMNLSLKDVNGEVLVISQFTLLGDCRKGRRPSYAQAAEPEKARNLYEFFVSKIESHGTKVATGEFQAKMDVHLINDGPVTLLLDSRKQF